MYKLFLYLHSWLRWVSLILLVSTFLISLINYLKKSPPLAFHQKSFKITRIMLGIEVLFGLVLYFILSPVTTYYIYHDFSRIINSSITLFSIKHPIGMMLAFVILRMGEKKAEKSHNKYKIWFIYSLVALLIICLCIPWPFVKHGRPLFRI